MWVYEMRLYKGGGHFEVLGIYSTKYDYYNAKKRTNQRTMCSQ